jgi:hypothetical protein
MAQLPNLRTYPPLRDTKIPSVPRFDRVPEKVVWGISYSVLLNTLSAYVSCLNRGSSLA